MVSLKTIAEKCGVSTATVSKALNDQRDISEETKNRVRKTAEALGYFPNAAARALKTNRSYNIGVLFEEDAYHKTGYYPIFTEISDRKNPVTSVDSFYQKLDRLSNAQEEILRRERQLQKRVKKGVIGSGEELTKEERWKRLSNNTKNKFKAEQANKRAALETISPKTKTERIRSLNNHYFERFKDNSPFTCAFLTSCFTGMRTGEVFALTWDDIDFENKIIDVKHSIYDKPKDIKGRWYIGTTKTFKGKRKIYMSETLCNALINFKKRQDYIKKISNLNGKC
jgi:integrase